jgi:O-antigen ligase
LYGFKKKNSNKLGLIGFSIYFLTLPLGAVNLSYFGSALKIVAIIPLVAFLVSHGLKFRISWISFWQSLFTFFLFLSTLYSINVQSTLQRVETNLLFLILLICMGSIVFNEQEIGKLKQALIWSSRLMAVLLLLFGSNVSGRMVFSGLIQEDPNYFSGYLLFGAVNAMQTILNYQKSKSLKVLLFNKIIPIIEMLFYFYIIFLTGSRGGLLSIIVSLIVLILFFDMRYSINVKLFKRFCLVVFFSFLVFSLVKIVPEAVKHRFYFDSIVESRGTGRYDLWNNALIIFRNENLGRQLFGFGAGTIREAYVKNGYHSGVTHNVFLETLVEGGVVSLVVYICLVLVCLKKAIKRKDLFLLVVFIGFVVLSFSTSLYSFKPYWNIIIFCNIVPLYFMQGNSKENFIACT